MSQNQGTHHNFQMTPYAIPSQSLVPAELNARHKDEYFHLWKGFARIPRPLVMWAGGFGWYFVISLFSASWTDDETLIGAISFFTFIAWLILAIIGTVKFHKGAKRIISWYPHLGLTRSKLTMMRKIVRRNVGYTFIDTFKAIFARLRLQPFLSPAINWLNKISLPQFDLFQNLTNNNGNNRELVATIQSYPSRANEMQYLRNLERELNLP